MVKTRKYFILKRNNRELLQDYLADLSPKGKRKVSIFDDYILIEKSVFTEADGSTHEEVTGVVTIADGCDLWKPFVKLRTMYDYTGVIMLIHIKGKVYTMDHYNELVKSKFKF